MVIFYFNLLILIAIITSLPSKPLINTKLLRKYSYNKVTTFLGKPSWPYELTLDINSQYNWLMNKGRSFLLAYGKFINNNVQMNWNNETYNCEEAVVPIYFSCYSKMKVSIDFYLINNTQIVNKGIIGLLALPFNYIKSHSLIHQYYSSGLIDHLSFSIVHDNQKEELYFGGIPSIAIENHIHSYCNVIGIRWDCLMSQVIIQNRTKEIILDFARLGNKGYMYFDTISMNFYFPKPFWEDFIQDYYSDAISSRQCNIRKSDEGRYMSCRDEYLIQMGNITFVIEDFAHTFQLSNLFACEEEFCQFLILENSHNEDWIIGSQFFMLYNVMFDYEEKRVYMHSITGINKINKPKHVSYEKRLFIGCILLNIFGLLLVIHMTIILA